MQALRGETYRKALSHLTDEQFEWAVAEAIKRLDWFPSVHELLDLADQAPQERYGGISGRVYAMLPREAQEAYAVQREARGLPMPQLSPGEAARAVEEVRRRSGLTHAARLPYKDPD